MLKKLAHKIGHMTPEEAEILCLYKCRPPQLYSIFSFHCHIFFHLATTTSDPVIPYIQSRSIYSFTLLYSLSGHQPAFAKG